MHLLPPILSLLSVAACSPLAPSTPNPLGDLEKRDTISCEGDIVCQYEAEYLLPQCEIAANNLTRTNEILYGASG